MTEYKYSRQLNENMARAVLRSAPISTKQSIEVCSHIRGKELKKAKRILKEASELQIPIPFKRFNGDVGHKPGIGPGRYAANASKHILSILESVEANAVNKGLDAESLVLRHISAQKASSPMRGGRKRGQAAKRTHVEVMVEEVAKKESKAKPKAKAQAKKPEAKAEPKAEAEKKAPVEEAKAEPKVEPKVEAKAETEKAPEKESKSEAKKGDVKND